MEIGAMLDELREKALKDHNIWQELMDTRKAEQPLEAFCAKCRELGYQIYEMDLITAGEEFYATMRRSTNGGGENSPKLAGEDDFYELFFASLEQIELSTPFFEQISFRQHLSQYGLVRAVQTSRP